MVAIWSAFAGLREGGEAPLSPLVWLVIPLIAVDGWLGRRHRRMPALAAWVAQPPVYWAGLGALTAILLALYPLQAAPFVYFQF